MEIVKIFQPLPFRMLQLSLFIDGAGLFQPIADFFYLIIFFNDTQ